MRIRCTNAFGNFGPGEEVEVPDGAAFDPAHFEMAELEPVADEEAKPAKEEGK